MLNIKNLEQFTDRAQTSMTNVVREYCQHLFLSYLYKQPGAEKLLFKGGTALRVVFGSPRYSEDLDFTGSHITEREIEDIFTNTLTNLEQVGIQVMLKEGKPTSGGYIGIMTINAYNKTIPIRIEISLRKDKPIKGTRALIESDYIPAYTLVHLSKEKIVEGKMQALINRHKPRDFYDYFFLLSNNDPIVKEKTNLILVLQLLNETKINFRNELREFLPASHAIHLRDFKQVLEQKIKSFLGPT